MERNIYNKKRLLKLNKLKIIKQKICQRHCFFASSGEIVVLVTNLVLEW